MEAIQRIEVRFAHPFVAEILLFLPQTHAYNCATKRSSLSDDAVWARYKLHVTQELTQIQVRGPAVCFSHHWVVTCLLSCNVYVATGDCSRRNAVHMGRVVRGGGWL